MKNLKQIITTLAIILFFVGTNQGYGQKKGEITSNQVKEMLIKGFADFVESLRPFYNNGDDLVSFKKKVLLGSTRPMTLPPITPDGDMMLTNAYNSLKNGLNYNQIIQKGDYKTIGNAILYIDNYMKSNRSNANNAQIALFGNSFVKNNPLELATRGKCKWWQLSCHLQQIFGENGGQTILNFIIEIIINLMKK